MGIRLGIRGSGIRVPAAPGNPWTRFAKKSQITNDKRQRDFTILFFLFYKVRLANLIIEGRLSGFVFFGLLFYIFCCWLPWVGVEPGWPGMENPASDQLNHPDSYYELYESVSVKWNKIKYI